MRDVIFLLADKNMEGVFNAFLSRGSFHQSLGCAEFTWDLYVHAVGHDPGLYNQAHQVLRDRQSTHRHAIVVVDAEWDGSPGAAAICADITANMVSVGWVSGSFEVIVPDPELEMWIWQDNIHVERALGYDRTGGKPTLRAYLEDQGKWDSGLTKPARPKEAVEFITRQTRVPRSSSVYGQIVEKVSVSRCQDPAFQLLRSTLRRWYPAGGQQ